MIKINLALKKSSQVAAETKGIKASVPKMDMSALSGFPIRKIAVAVIAVYAANYFLGDMKEQEIKKVETKLQAVTAEQNALQAQLAKTRGYEDLKKQLEADEKTMQTKIDVVQKLIADRTLPPKVLMAVSQGIPKDVWLSDLQINDDGVKFEGSALDFNPISDFIKNLGESVYFTDPKLITTEKSKDDTGNESAHFLVQAKRRENK